MTGPAPGAKLVAGLIAAIASCGVLVLALPLSLSYEIVKARLDAMAEDGSVGFLTPEYYSAVEARLSIAGILLLTVAAVLFIGRKRLVALVAPRLVTGRSDVRSLLDDASSIRKHGPSLYTVCAITLVALLVRLAFLDQPMRSDESFTYLRYVTLPWYLVVTHYDFGLPNNHIFHTVLVKAATTLFGNSPAAIRLPALVAGLLLVPASYGIGCMLYDRRVGVLGAALVASNSVLVEYSTNARGYSLIALAFLVTLMLAIYVKDRRNWVAWALLAIVATLGFYTLLLMVQPFGIVITWLLISAARRGGLRDRLALVRRVVVLGATVLVATLTLYAPALISMPLRGEGFGMLQPHSQSESFITVFFHSLTNTWEQWHASVPRPLTIVLAGGAILALLLHRRLGRYPFIVVSIVLWPTLFVIVHGVVPFARMWQFLIPIYAILSSAGLIYLYDRVAALRARQYLIPAFAIALAVALSLNLVRTETPGHDRIAVEYVRDACDLLSKRLRPGEKVVALVPTASPMLYYARRGALDESVVITEGNASVWDRSNEAQSVYVIVYTKVDYLQSSSFESIAQHIGFPLSDTWDVDAAEVVRTYDSAVLYRLPRLTPND